MVAMNMMLFAAVLVVLLLLVDFGGANNLVFKMHHKYSGNGSSILSEMRAHDLRCHGRMVAAVDFQLAGNGQPVGIALYYTRLRIGTPPKVYNVQVDTRSDILWVNCAGCDKCPKESSLGIDLKQYDIKASSTANSVTCDQDLCNTIFLAPYSGCNAGRPCEYQISYGDGSTTAGYFVQDYIHFDQATGNLQTTSMNRTIVFGCSGKQSGLLCSSFETVDGIIGFGQANSSLISQLTALGKVKKIFSHCLNRHKGGGILAIGQVVQPKVNSTPLVPNQPHYNVILKSIEVGGIVLDIPTNAFDTASGKGTIIDSGTTLAYFADRIYDPLMDKLMEKQKSLEIQSADGFKCFSYNGNVDDGFPDVTLHFEDSLKLTILPHDYLFRIQDGRQCIGWQNTGGPTKDGKELTLLGDIVLSGKLVVYDLESQSIGWIEHDCSTGIKVKDESTG